MSEKARIGRSGVLAVGFGAIVVGLCVVAAFSLEGKMSGGLGGSVFPTPVSQKRVDDAPNESASAEAIKIDRQKSVVIVRVPVPVKEEPPSEESARAAWGQLGDYFGGTLNPVFGFASLVLLLLTLGLQARELSLTRRDLEQATQAQKESAEALRKQGFEQTFFAWLSTYRGILASVSYKDGVGQHSEGTQALKAILNWFMFDSQLVITARQRIHLVRKDSARTPSTEELWEVSMESWEQLYEEYESELGSLFRVLYRLIKWIDEHPALSRDEKWLYVGIVRSQLSWIEMVLLFYNGSSSRGDNFKVLIERYALFDNLRASEGTLLRDFIDAEGCQAKYKQAAYSSDEARRLMDQEEALAVVAKKTGDKGQAINNNGSH